MGIRRRPLEQRWEVLFIKIAEHEELSFEYNRILTVSKDSLYEKLTGIKNEKSNEVLIVEKKNDYTIYYKEEGRGDVDYIKIWPALKMRIETGWNEVKEKLKELNQYLSENKVKNDGYKYYDMKKIFFNEDFFIIDIYVKKIVN